MVIDAYAHVGLPRFLSLAHYQRHMQRHDITRAVLCSFDSSPDLAAIHAAMTEWPDRFRCLGVPLGDGRTEIEAGAHAQLQSGFSGLRLTDADVTERGWLLNVLGAHDGTMIVCGQAFSDSCARALLDHLERYPGCTVIGGHFAGVRDPSALTGGVLAALFDHPRFNVVFSRHGAFAPAAVESWTHAVLARTGWSRVMWGSEVPILFWRNETIASALAWVDRLGPSMAERAAFLGGNAARLYFAKQHRLAPLNLPFAPQDRMRTIPAGLFSNGLAVDQAVAGRLVQAWCEADTGESLGVYVTQLLDTALLRINDDTNVEQAPIF
jgi:predicted TIM-barrel fold metal-dependent hydrolase